MAARAQRSTAAGWPLRLVAPESRTRRSWLSLSRDCADLLRSTRAEQPLSALGEHALEFFIETDHFERFVLRHLLQRRAGVHHHVVAGLELRDSPPIHPHLLTVDNDAGTFNGHIQDGTRNGLAHQLQ